MVSVVTLGVMVTRTVVPVTVEVETTENVVVYIVCDVTSDATQVEVTVGASPVDDSV
jgi:hypothetical protein